MRAMTMIVTMAAAAAVATTPTVTATTTSQCHFARYGANQQQDRHQNYFNQLQDRIENAEELKGQFHLLKP